MRLCLATASGALVVPVEVRIWPSGIIYILWKYPAPQFSAVAGTDVILSDLVKRNVQLLIPADRR
jgi:hypothetical protein